MILCAVLLFLPIKPTDFRWDLNLDFGVAFVNVLHYIISTPMVWRLSFKMDKYNLLSIIPSIKTSLPTPNADIQLQTITEPPPYFTVDFMFFIFKASLGFLHTMRRQSGPKMLNLLSSLNITVFQNSKDLDLFWSAKDNLFCLLASEISGFF